MLIFWIQFFVRVNVILEKLYSFSGFEFCCFFFLLKQIFQEDKDLVFEFVYLEGLSCLICVGVVVDYNYQSYIFRVFGQLMFFVDGMLGVVVYSDIIQWLYILCVSLFCLVVKIVLKLLLVFVEYFENNVLLFICVVNFVVSIIGVFFWVNLVFILEEKNGVDFELLVYMVIFINKMLVVFLDQDFFYDVMDVLEQQGMEVLVQCYLGIVGIDVDLCMQFVFYENVLKLEDGDIEEVLGVGGWWE